MLSKIILIGVGGALGSVMRHLLAVALAGSAEPRFPYSTLLVNVSGCFAIGLLATALAADGPWPARESVRLALLVGVLGGYTTFSTFGLETINLARAGRAGHAAAYVLLSTALSLAAVWAGWRIASLLGQRGA